MSLERVAHENGAGKVAKFLQNWHDVDSKLIYGLQPLTRANPPRPLGPPSVEALALRIVKRLRKLTCRANTNAGQTLNERCAAGQTVLKPFALAAAPIRPDIIRRQKRDKKCAVPSAIVQFFWIRLTDAQPEFVEKDNPLGKWPPQQSRQLAREQGLEILNPTVDIVFGRIAYE